MRRILLTAIALGAMGSVAWAQPPGSPAGQTGPVELTDAQMDAVTAAGIADLGLGTPGLDTPGFKKKKGGFQKAKVKQFAFSKNTSNAATVGLCKLCITKTTVWQSSAATNAAVVIQK